MSNDSGKDPIQVEFAFNPKDIPLILQPDISDVDELARAPVGTLFQVVENVQVGPDSGTRRIRLQETTAPDVQARARMRQLESEHARFQKD